MRAILLFAVVIITWCQKLEAKEINEAVGNLRNELVSIKDDRDVRSIGDIWNSIKITAKHAWEHIKNLTVNIKKRIADWVGKVKIKAQDLGKTFQKQLNKMKDRVNEMIDNIKKAGETMKKCLQERKKEIDEILKKIIFDVTNCIANSVIELNNSTALQYEPNLNQTEFLNVIENDLNVCMKYETNIEVEECVQNIRKGVYKNVEINEEYILQNHIRIRSATDDLLNTIVVCTTDGIIKATTAIANETIQIIECISNE